MKTFNYNLPPWETKNKSMVRSLTSTYMFLMHRLQYVMSVIMITVLFGTFQTALKKVFTQRFNPFYRRMLVMNTLGGKLWLKVNIFNYLRITLLTTDQWSANKKSGSGSALLLHWSLKQICGLFDCLFVFQTMWFQCCSDKTGWVCKLWRTFVDVDVGLTLGPGTKTSSVMEQMAVEQFS